MSPHLLSSIFTAIPKSGPFDVVIMAFAGGQGVLRAVLAILAFSWFGLFVFFGGWLSILLLQGLAGSKASVGQSGTLYWLSHIVLGFLVAFALSGRATGSRYVQAVVGVLLVLSIPGAAMVASLLGSPIPILGMITALPWMLYTSFVAAPLLLMIWGLRSLAMLARQLALGPYRADALLTTQLGAVGAAIAAGLTTAIAILAGADAWLVDQDWFYVMALPAVIGFGIAAPPPRRPSWPFAALAALMAVSIGWTAIPAMGERHAVACGYWTGGGEHRVFYRSGEPWTWKKPKDAREWVRSPVILAELTIWHILDPVTRTDCPPW
jgi:hypothetical protein